jgi:hypothetical protein
MRNSGLISTCGRSLMPDPFASPLVVPGVELALSDVSSSATARARLRQEGAGSSDGPAVPQVPGAWGTAAVSAAVLPPWGAGGHLSVGPAGS